MVLIMKHFKIFSLFAKIGEILKMMSLKEYLSNKFALSMNLSPIF